MRGIFIRIACLTMCGTFGAFGGDAAVGQEMARYRLEFDSIWSAATHPTDWPGNSAHYSSLVGGLHNSDVTFWEVGGLATSGIESMAETGASGGVRSEVNAAIAAGTAGSQIFGGGIGRSPGKVAVEFDVTREYPLATVVSMIAPSPDWFVGVSGLDLRDGDGWVGKTVHALHPYDSGTDDGVTFRSGNADSNPAIPIHRLDDVFPFEETGPLGTFTFRRLLDGDFNETGTYDGGDIDSISDAIRSGNMESQYDLNGDNIVSSADRDFLIHDTLNTFAGDANLDGEFGSSDLTLVFQASQYEDEIAGNSTWATGDWNGDREFDSGDLVFSFTEGAYEQGPRPPAVAVPEPSRIGFALVASIAMLFVRNRRNYQ
ncbi:spondin domain-containing protein [Planctomycetota bacterium]